VGNGLRTSLWYDTWCDQSPLANFLTPRDITRNIFHLRMCVADIITNGAWDWPQAWLLKAPNLGLIPVLVLNDIEDCIRWRDGNGNVTSFSVKCAWEALLPQGVEVPWYSIVWFSHCIPRYAFHMWLIMRRSLKTQDKLRSWDSLLRHLAGMERVAPVLEDIIAWLLPIGAKRSFNSVVGKLLFAATTYFIWSERNNRLFKNQRRTPEDIRDLVMVTVRLKLVTFRFKNKSRVAKMLSEWKMPSNFRLYSS
ncbi:putative reverse transcriptase domain-containing protein, partial [Tanacetum coccineum]